MARDAVASGKSLGLVSMEERASLAGGRMECRSAPGKGTEIRAWFPLRADSVGHGAERKQA
ncbi:hypothetical protein D3C83_194300 [compost metagenome]